MVSTLSSIWIVEKNGNKRRGIEIAFLINAIILTIAALFLYKLDVQIFHKQTTGIFASLGIGVLIIFIPIITYFNYFILELLMRKKTETVSLK